MDKLKVVFMGTPDFAVPSLKALVESGKFDVPLVITQPDKPAGRGKRLTPPAVKKFALEKGIPVIQPEKIKENRELFEILKEISPDFIVVAAYGKILPVELLNIPLIAPVNVHASLLPKYRGASPIQSAILNGEKETGVTIMRVRERLDSGEIYIQEKTEISDEDTAETLHDRLSVMGGKLLVEALPRIASGELKPIPQNESEATYCGQIKKEDGLIDWSEPAKAIFNKIRAFTPWPSAFTYFNGKLLKIMKAKPVGSGSCDATGKVVSVDDEGFTVSTGDGFLKILKVKPEGRKEMEACDFIRGYRVKEGDILGGKE
ncbi:methionyl-tRNA formyltransferase [Desulfurobacterium atlanticum]|uniref:Methionyl-tRNA formyltransferase n=1 Tax=Desulfurobacterium atlanticum TaxID=240169 RepID=A0A238YEC6_9BACT|nr:methionyl-tRNA formyltransferase [Desulfurobacterium atlanticum]SNR69410.1 methionyl-tRNA formyltransferase [Desulfurobacterium atlanticum]